MESLKAIFAELILRYTDDVNFSENLWKKLDENYSKVNKRPYHNWLHISDLLSLSEQHQSVFENKDDVLFAIFFHDVIYNTLKTDNEEKSAVFAQKYLSLMSFPKDRIDKIAAYIIATKTHQNPTQDSDLSYFLDFDLTILGSESSRYQAYTQQIRKEYSIYPDFMYKPGRKKVLVHFLEKPTIFKTEIFQELLEEKAKENLRWELDMLNN
jgi:predicted metal-dependent HD superfamily phosphohydrolase